MQNHYVLLLQHHPIKFHRDQNNQDQWPINEMYIHGLKSVLNPSGLYWN